MQGQNSTGVVEHLKRTILNKSERMVGIVAVLKYPLKIHVILSKCQHMIFKYVSLIKSVQYTFYYRPIQN